MQRAILTRRVLRQHHGMGGDGASRRRFEIGDQGENMTMTETEDNYGADDARHPYSRAT